jgi:hypothetical protein
MKFLYISIVILAVFAIVSCKKGNTSSKVITLTATNSGTTVAALKGETIRITLSNPGDGGYQLNDPKFDDSILSLTGHTHQAPTTGNTGDFGTDTWTFSVKGSGKTTLSISAARNSPGTDQVMLFSGEISVN